MANRLNTNYLPLTQLTDLAVADISVTRILDAVTEIETGNVGGGGGINVEASNLIIGGRITPTLVSLSGTSNVTILTRSGSLEVPFRG